MAIVTKTLRDSSGATFKMRFWDDGAGNLSPLHALTADAGEVLPVQVSGSSVDLRGLLANRPAATAVDAGTTYWAVDRIGQVDEVSVSDGTDWQYA